MALAGQKDKANQTPQGINEGNDLGG